MTLGWVPSLASVNHLIPCLMPILDDRNSVGYVRHDYQIKYSPALILGKPCTNHTCTIYPCHILVDKAAHLHPVLSIVEMKRLWHREHFVNVHSVPPVICHIPCIILLIIRFSSSSIYLLRVSLLTEFNIKVLTHQYTSSSRRCWSLTSFHNTFCLSLARCN
jgi:hypothetical protein